MLQRAGARFRQPWTATGAPLAVSGLPANLLSCASLSSLLGVDWCCGMSDGGGQAEAGNGAGTSGVVSPRNQARLIPPKMSRRYGWWRVTYAVPQNKATTLHTTKDRLCQQPKVIPLNAGTLSVTDLKVLGSGYSSYSCICVRIIHNKQGDRSEGLFGIRRILRITTLTSKTPKLYALKERGPNPNARTQPTQIKRIR